MNKASKQAQENKGPVEPEQVWEDLLSRQSTLIKKAFVSLDPIDQASVLTHLQRMVSESGWQPEQRLSAQAALDVLLSKPK